MRTTKQPRTITEGRLRRGALPGLGMLAALGCGTEGPPDSSSAFSGIAPAGSAVTFVSNTVPATMAPGERANVQVTTLNSGTVDWSSLTEWGLFRGNTSFGWSVDFIEELVPQGNSTTHNLVITAPASSANFVAEMYSFIPGSSGPVAGTPLTVPVTVDPLRTRLWDCEYASDTIPDPIIAGATADVTVTVRNTGTETWPGGNQFCLHARDDLDATAPDRRRWGSAICTLLTASVAPGATAAVPVRITAPTTPGTYRFMRQILDTRPVNSGGVGFFDVTALCVDETITVSAGTLPLAASLVSETFPAVVAPGDVVPVTVTMRNDGTETWTTGGLYLLYSRNTPASLWSATAVTVPATTATNETVTFAFNVRVPTQTGSSSFQYQMLKGDGTGYFGDLVNEPVTISGAATPALNSSVSGSSFPAVIAPNSVQSVSVTFQNDGTETWAPGNYFLASTNTPTSLWQTTGVNLPGSVAPGQQVTFNFTVRAPNQAGASQFRFRLFLNGVGFFGAELVESVLLDGSVVPPYGATVASQTIPATMVAGSSQTFTIQMANAGTNAWPANSDIELRSENSPFALWTTSRVPLTTMTSTNGTATFTFSVTAPSTPGTYSSRFRMYQLNGVLFFGSAASTTGITVTAAPGCGDGVVGPGENCDDGNTVPGDGCSATCRIENRTVDLASASAGRTFVGAQVNKQLSAVTLEDLTGDGFADVIMSDFSNVGILGQAGRVYVYAGASDFFTGASSSVDAAPLVTINGFGAGDFFGGINGGAMVADVTGDGLADLVVGAEFAGGTGNARPGSGQVHVIPGSATLYAGGTFTLAGTSTITPAIPNTVITGEASGDRLTVIALGDVTNDGISDIILGSRFSDSARGVVYVVAGSAGLTTTSTIDLASATIAARIVGAATVGRFGQAAAVGDLNGDGVNDLVVSAPSITANGRSRAGAAYVFFGPISGSLSASSANTTILGEAANVLYGTDLDIADVVGTPTADLIVGAPQARDGGLQIGEVHVWQGPLATGTIDNAVQGSAVLVTGTLRDYVGGSVSVGDMNGDGVPDLLIGGGLADGPSDSRTDAGEAIILLGGSTLPGRVGFTSSAPFRVIGESARDLLGFTRFSTAVGDINGDGRGDWCVGAYLGGDSAGTNAGRIDCFQSPW